MRDKIALFLTFLILVIWAIYSKYDILLGHLKEFYIHFTPKPTVSVVLPSYNMAKTLPEAIDSIINQTYTDWECLVINDGSLDKTKEVLKPYVNNYKIRIIHNRKNLGLIQTLNKGIKLSRGKYIARLDADDISLPDRLERQVTIMEKENLDFLGQIHYYTAKIDKEKENNFDTYSAGVELFKRVYFSHTSIMMKKSFLIENNIKYNLEYENAEDYDLYLAIFYSGGKMGEMGGQPITVYRPARHSLYYYSSIKVNHEKIKVHYLSKVIPNFDRFKILPLTLCELLPIVIDGNKITSVLDQKELEKQYKLKCGKHTK